MKNYLIPHKGNKYNPTIFKKRNLGIILLVGIIAVAASYVGTFVVRNSQFLASIQSALLVDLANKDRQEESVATLAINPLLVEAAEKKALDMATKGYFAHTSPEGLTPWYWFREVGYTYLYAGENLAVNFSDSIDVHKAWIASPTHKQNILDKRFIEIGIATAEGVYKGRKATFVVQMFGRPRFSLISAAGTAHSTSTVVLDTIEYDTKNIGSDREVLGEQDEYSFAQHTSGIERVVVSPRMVGQIILIGLIAMLIAALALRLGVEYKKHHTGKVVLLVLVIVGLSVLLYVQQTILSKPVEISQTAEQDSRE